MYGEKQKDLMTLESVNGQVQMNEAVSKQHYWRNTFELAG